MMRACPFSIRAIHIIAFALRALLFKSLNTDVSMVERKAMGEYMYLFPEDIPIGDNDGVSFLNKRTHP